MPDFVLRTCTEFGEDGQVRKNADESDRTCLSFEEFRAADAYVLLGPPGAGKSKTFEQEAACLKACYVTARDFITFDDRPEWHNITLFIDGLDEKRAGSPDGRTPLDEIRKKLALLGRPRFRLSCREADWFGANDRDNLKAISCDGKIAVLRLDPLTDEDVHKILRDHLEADDPETFVREARRRGLETLLANPKMLEMLVEAVRGGEWPSTRKQTFDVACRTLLREHNQEHRVAQPVNVDISVQLDAAGRLCAVQLLTGGAGYALPSTESNYEYPGLEQVSGEDQEVLRYVLGTKLFVAPSEGRAAPVHRHVAEFLGGRYLAGLVENEMPVGRILALMTGDDGGIVSELRGLSAWLAANSKTSRTKIIEHDPIGTVLYGDVRDFSIDEKRKLIDGLYQESQKNPWFFGTLERRDSSFADLATPDMEPVFREVLTSQFREDTHQALVLCLVEALRHGPAIPELTDVVLGVVKDDSWRTRIRDAALATILHHSKTEQHIDDKLMALLADVYDGSVPDSDDQLLGQLLCALYPSKLSAAEILRYLRLPKRRDHFGMYKRFWTGHVVENSTNAQCTELLDILIARSDELSEKIRKDPTDTRNPIYHLPSNLLVRFLNDAQEEIAPGKLFSWLKVAAWNDLERRVPPDGAEGIRAWLSQHPETQKTMIAACVKDCRGKQRFDVCVGMMRHRLLFDATPPPGFGSWCLEQATSASDENAALWYIREVAHALDARWYDEGLTWEIVEERLATHPTLEKAVRECLSEREESKNRGKALREESAKETSKEQQEFRDHVKKSVAALRENRCPPSLLNDLAAAYFGDPINRNRLFDGETSTDRLHNLLGGDAVLVETVLVALRNSVNRSDVPSDAEIIRLSAGNWRHPLELPFLAGLEELSEPDNEPILNERQMRQAIAFYYNSGALPYYRGERPHWYRRLLALRPDVISDVLIKFVRSQLRSRKERFADARELTASKEHEVIARLVALSLLTLFPVRCTSSQLSLLNVLLIAALLHSEKEAKKAFEQLIERKLTFQSLNVTQRVYWLAAGLLSSPALYRETLVTLVSGYERRIRHLAEFLTAFPSTLLDRFGVQDLELLIRLVGVSYRPYPDYSPSREFSTDWARWGTSALVTGLINRLASLPSPDATQALESLSSDNALTPWRSRLRDAVFQQKVTRREASFQHHDIPTVLQTLDKRSPANAADLAALTTHILSDMAKQIRDGNTSPWRQYWNVDSHNRPQDQKPEDGCRDTLLLDLRRKLEPLGIHAQQEGYYTDDKRADMRVGIWQLQRAGGDQKKYSPGTVARDQGTVNCQIYP